MAENKGLKRGRRDALKNIVIGAGSITAFPILGQTHRISAAPAHTQMEMPATTEPESNAEWKPVFFDQHQNETVVALTELIIPQTDTPGAKAAQVNRYLDLLYNEESSDRQEDLIRGLAWLDGLCLSLHQKPFTDLTAEQQTAILQRLADPNNKNPEDAPGAEFFVLIKDLTIFGYYTSKIGLEQELQYEGGTYNESFPGACTHPEHQS